MAEKIALELRSHGPIPFSRFMELALYCPEYGFYEAERDITGRKGVFYTSVSVGPLFGQLLGYQFCEWLLEPNGQSRPLRLIEAGAHDGQLASDILDWIAKCRPEAFARLEYWILEPSARLRAIQQERLLGFRGKMRWASDFPELVAIRKQTSRGKPAWTIFFSNELLDAMPVDRFGWDAHRQSWFEWSVALQGERFVWERLPCDPGKVAKALGPAVGQDPNGFQLSPDLLRILPESFTIDVSITALGFWRSAAEFLDEGRLVTFDYGLEVQDLFSPERHEGTLRAYHRHQVSADVLAQPGKQDLTAHVNFTAIQRTGEAAGLETDMFLSQGQFLTGIAVRAASDPSSFGEWTREKVRQFQTLTHPEHLGRAFRVLVQSR